MLTEYSVQSTCTM